MLKRSLKKVGLSLLFAGVLSVGLSIKSANAITESQEKLLKAVENVVRKTEGSQASSQKTANNFYCADTFWERVGQSMGGKKGESVRFSFSYILGKEGVVLKKNNYWTEIFEPYKEELKKNSGLKLSEFISKNLKEATVNNSYVNKKREIWTDEEEDKLILAIRKCLEEKGKEYINNKKFWTHVSNYMGGTRNGEQLRKHFCNYIDKLNLEKGKNLNWKVVLSNFDKHFNAKKIVAIENRPNQTQRCGYVYDGYESESHNDGEEVLDFSDLNNE